MIAPARDEKNWSELSSYEQEAAKASASKKWLTRDELAELTKIKTWVWVRDLTINWLLILSTIELAILAGHRLPWWGGVLAYSGAFCLIGCWQNGMIQWRHEASHYNLSRNRKLNDTLGDIFIAAPVGSTVPNYRFHHVPHHVYLNDPSREIQPATWICVRGMQLFKELFQQMTGFWYVKTWVNPPHTADEQRAQLKETKSERRPTVSMAALCSVLFFNGAIFAACWLQGAWYAYFILWAFPPYSLALTINNFRTLLEHQPSSDICEVGRSVKLEAFTRIIRANWLEKWLIAPVGFGYHYEHHAWPSIPYHRLPEAHAILKKKGFFESEPMIYSQGYLRTLWQLAFQEGWGLRILNPFVDLEEEMEHAHSPAPR